MNICTISLRAQRAVIIAGLRPRRNPRPKVSSNCQVNVILFFALILKKFHLTDSGFSKTIPVIDIFSCSFLYWKNEMDFRGTGYLICLLTISLFGLTGCGQADGVGETVPVEGTVTLGKEPLKTGTITFNPKAGGKTATGSIENGKYKMMTGTKEGVVPGQYEVAIFSSVPSNPKDEYSVPKSLINEKFNDASASNLSADVKAGGGPYDFTVTK